MKNEQRWIYAKICVHCIDAATLNKIKGEMPLFKYKLPQVDLLDGICSCRLRHNEKVFCFYKATLVVS